ncbi:MAG: DUF2273 domain-containing protein [Peptoniphilus sp.]|nr:DUF2273 domain-containing protein [Peptoniphilus sp.]MDD7362536.1 DUF2273 domain-containing protein [Bacillota bacterium]MDY6045065.1 DUF2273 domain-containing protein [Peptoniphilus sp.]
MKLFTQDLNGQFQYIGEYDSIPSPPGNQPVIGNRDNAGNFNPNGGRYRRFFNRYSKTTWGLIIGLIVGILFLSIGFFQTLLLAILMAIGFVIGGFFDRNPIVMKFLSNFG